MIGEEVDGGRLLLEGIMNASCVVTQSCSAQLQLLITSCHVNCTIDFAPHGAHFRLEQRAALLVTATDGLTIDAHGATLELDGDAPFLWVSSSVNFTLRNVTLVAARPCFSYGVVVAPQSSNSQQVANGMVQLAVDTSLYAFPPGPALSWTRSVAALHQVDPATHAPTDGGIDWLYNNAKGQPPLSVTVSTAAGTTGLSSSTNGSARIVSFADRGFGLSAGDGVVLRHLLEYSAPRLDAIVMTDSRDIVISDVNFRSAPGMAVLSHNCSDITLLRVHSAPVSVTRSIASLGGGNAVLPLGVNADFIHLASCRGAVTIAECSAHNAGGV